jgi:hypothetical protein
VGLLRWRWGPKYVQKPNIFFKNIKKCYHIFPECLITSGYYKIISVHFEAVFKTKKATLAVCRSKITTQKTDGQPTKTFIILSIFMILPSN